MSQQSALRRIFSLRSPYPYLAAATAGLSWWTSVVLSGVNVQKAHSGIFKAVMFHLRHDPTAKQLLGTDITYDAKRDHSVEGDVNMQKGRADFRFGVQGSEGRAEVRFRGSGKGDNWTSEVFTVVTPEGKTVEY
ncbi:cytochrome oxidase complex assembly protein 1-domain-containing protein [Fimicolochytrium jonesii]|uniref:cytochrome oxidase complex assembly protein 1-domain-containing protein n=1 Tax=Fimicolochytrium jonesii TaxID=1396493 RepID=UPI0022FEB548|nr:cytochrome oxidase complex assembly protein 1-domain-containing protein [Fimicolochytrium jonesii]KAI8826703.1 cytochrome oxidase complex assembly protein 1-domain-containing protein [Fimicolochytrium jonesii]